MKGLRDSLYLGANYLASHGRATQLKSRAHILRVTLDHKQISMHFTEESTRVREI